MVYSCILEYYEAKKTDELKMPKNKVQMSATICKGRKIIDMHSIFLIASRKDH